MWRSYDLRNASNAPSQGDRVGAELWILWRKIEGVFGAGSLSRLISVH